MAKKEEYIPINKAQKTAVQDYLQSRLGIYGVHNYDFEWSRHDNVSYKESAEQEILPKHLGIMTHMIKKCVLIIKVWNEEQEMKNISISLQYEHKPDGGSNGHDTDIKLIVHPDGRIYEMEK